MFTRKKRELNKKTISKKSQGESFGSHNSSPTYLKEQTTKDGVFDIHLPLHPSVQDTQAPCCPTTPCLLHPRLATAHSSSHIPGALLKRPTLLSRNASAAGFPLQVAGAWVFSKTQRKGVSRASSPTTEVSEVGIEVDDIPHLLRDVAHFAEAVDRLKEIVLGEDRLVDELSDSHLDRRTQAQECLGEVLRVLRQVIGTYPLLNTVETLTAAGTLISKVKGFSYDNSSDKRRQDFDKAIETMAVAFSSNVSELLMGELDSSTLLSLPLTDRSRSVENLHDLDCVQVTHCQCQERSNQEDCCMLSGEKVDLLLQLSKGGVDLAFSYAKAVSRYIKDVISYLEKRTALEMEFAKGLQRLYQSCKQTIAQPHMPFFSIYSLALEQDSEQSVEVQQTTASIQTFLQHLMQCKQEHERRCREIREQWQRPQRKLIDAESILRKAQGLYMIRYEEYDKARSRAEEELQVGGGGPKALERKRRLEEEARAKAEEAEAVYRACISEAEARLQEREQTKISTLRQIHDVIRHTDHTLRSVTVSYYQLMHMQTAALPLHYQTLCESTKLYEPGQQYAAHARLLHTGPENARLLLTNPEPTAHFRFEAYSTNQLPGRTRKTSSTTEAPNCMGEEEERAGDIVTQRACHGYQTLKSWPSTMSDSNSLGGVYVLETPSTGILTKADEELVEPDENVDSFEQEPEMAVPTGPFRNVRMSEAARTHRLRKLRTPAKCRECDSYVYFQGAECEECLLASHRRCLESLAIQCGHKKLQARLSLFGRDFKQGLGDLDGVPLVIRKCITEIDSRALTMKGIYRVNGVKTRVEKLCQAFENGKELVELSQASPHDISNILKLYLRQLPEPVFPFCLYPSLMGMAKESLLSESPSPEGGVLTDMGPETPTEVLNLVHKLRELIQKKLPKANIAILRYITKHLRRVCGCEQENKMSASNLGIVFGPTLMRPRPSGATVSLSSLVDYPHQARIVETLIVFYSTLFHEASCSTTDSPPALSQDSGGEDWVDCGDVYGGDEGESHGGDEGEAYRGHEGEAYRGDEGEAYRGDEGEAYGGDERECYGGDEGESHGGDEGEAYRGDEGEAYRGDEGEAYRGDERECYGGDEGEAYGGDERECYGGDEGESHGGDEGEAYRGHEGEAYRGDEGEAYGGDERECYGGDEGESHGGDEGEAYRGDEGEAYRGDEGEAYRGDERECYGGDEGEAYGGDERECYGGDEGESHGGDEGEAYRGDEGEAYRGDERECYGGDEGEAYRGDEGEGYGGDEEEGYEADEGEGHGGDEGEGYGAEGYGGDEGEGYGGDEGEGYGGDEEEGYEADEGEGHGGDEGEGYGAEGYGGDEGEGYGGDEGEAYGGDEGENRTNLLTNSNETPNNHSGRSVNSDSEEDLNTGNIN
ncbi:rho GTPase-activating protein 45 isoform X2 [Esox lucius]|uniref:rho GTPase-activating protein 45 isoform X2 n=1 Tax=Esox lucius TaxID=8010 RepID=UPI001476FF94|nr:rho GTPase-activating protein 45 isoform X2 [Esox lucius]